MASVGTSLGLCFNAGDARCTFKAEVWMQDECAAAAAAAATALHHQDTEPVCFWVLVPGLRRLHRLGGSQRSDPYGEHRFSCYWG